MSKKWKSTGSERLDREIPPFDLLAKRGRWVGSESAVRARSWEGAPDARTWSDDNREAG